MRGSYSGNTLAFQANADSSILLPRSNQDKYQMNLLFVPLDIEIPEINFKLGERYTFRQPYWESKNVLGKENNYQEYRNLLDQIPIINITTFTFKVQKKATKPHIDYYPNVSDVYGYKRTAQNEPAGYHIVLKGKFDSLEVFNGKEWINPILPKVPIAYLLNLTSCVHKVKEDELRETLYIQGWLDIEKHTQLIERSLKKYGDLAIYRQI